MASLPYYHESYVASLIKSQLERGDIQTLISEKELRSMEQSEEQSEEQLDFCLPKEDDLQHLHIYDLLKKLHPLSNINQFQTFKQLASAENEATKKAAEEMMKTHHKKLSGRNTGASQIDYIRAKNAQFGLDINQPTESEIEDAGKILQRIKASGEYEGFNAAYEDFRLEGARIDWVPN